MQAVPAMVRIRVLDIAVVCSEFLPNELKIDAVRSDTFGTEV